MRRTIPAVAVTALALASAAVGAHAATTASAPTGSVHGNPGRTTTAPLVVTPGSNATPSNMDAGPFSPAAPNTVGSTAPAPGATSPSTVTATGTPATNVTNNPALVDLIIAGNKTCTAPTH